VRKMNTIPLSNSIISLIIQDIFDGVEVTVMGRVKIVNSLLFKLTKAQMLLIWLFCLLLRGISLADINRQVVWPGHCAAIRYVKLNTNFLHNTFVC